jgi:hypothetical protein
VGLPIGHSPVADRPLADAFLKVNLDAPDKIIEHDFKTWLCRAKEAFSAAEKQKEFTKAQGFRNWAAAKVLEYLDVMHWNKLNNGSPSYQDLANIVYLGEGKGGEQIKNPTKKHADRLMTREAIITLAYQVLHERQGKV